MPSLADLLDRAEALIHDRLLELDEERQALLVLSTGFKRLQNAHRPHSPWQGIRLHEAITLALEESPSPLRPPAIAKILMEHGVRTDSGNLTNVVGVTLNKRKGKDYQRTVDGAWTVVKKKKPTPK